MLDDLKELDKFLKICRKQGVNEITFQGIAVKFGDLPVKSSEAIEEEIPTETLTPEQLMFYATEQAVI